MDVLKELRERTSSDHQRLERDLDLLGPSSSRDRYAAFLRQMAGLVVPYEQAWDAIPSFQRALPDYETRRKSALLLMDLERLGERAPLTMAKSFRPLNCAGAFGLGYVLEGSTLGGVVIAREVSERLGAACPTAYLTCYGAALGSQWKKFCAALTTYCAADRTRTEQVVEHARRAFAEAYSWLTSREVAA